MLSFIFYLHSSRIQNLLQVIRFLEKRESNLYGSEILLIIQDELNLNIPSNFTINKIELNSSTYNKPKMCNLGVKNSKYDIIALLDSDRILPNNYFFDTCKSIQKGSFITTKYIKCLSKNYEDFDIEKELFKHSIEEKSTKNENRKKNMFSGNTVFYKEDYLTSGGMDENYIGYGFADTDMTKNVENYNLIYKKLCEIHLYHEKYIIYNNEKEKLFNIFTIINALYYFKKWKLKPDKNILNVAKYILNNNKKYKPELIEILKTKLGYFKLC